MAATEYPRAAPPRLAGYVGLRYVLRGGAWYEIGRFSGPERVAVAPFDAVTINLGNLWVPGY